MFHDRANANVIPLLTALVVGFFFLEPPWRWLILIPAALVDAVDIIVWLRWRKKKSIAGAEGLVGSKGRVASMEDEGRVIVRAKGQLWRADVVGTVHENDDVIVTQVDGIRLTVEPLQHPTLGEKSAS